MKVPKNSWSQFKTALEGLLTELVKGSENGRAEEASGEGVKKLVTDTVSSILLEGELFDKLVARSLRVAQDGREENGPGPASEAVRRIVEKSFQENTKKMLIPCLTKELQQMIQEKVREFGNTEEFKALLDSRFRIMEQYLRGEVIPRALKDAGLG